MESPAKAVLDETSHMFENRGVQMLGQIKHGSCRPRAILFKVLADTVGLESRLVVVSFDISWWAQLLSSIHLTTSLLIFQYNYYTTTTTEPFSARWGWLHDQVTYCILF